MASKNPSDAKPKSEKGTELKRVSASFPAMGNMPLPSRSAVRRRPEVAAPTTEVVGRPSDALEQIKERWAKDVVVEMESDGDFFENSDAFDKMFSEIRELPAGELEKLNIWQAEAENQSYLMSKSRLRGREETIAEIENDLRNRLNELKILNTTKSPFSDNDNIEVRGQIQELEILIKKLASMREKKAKA